MEGRTSPTAGVTGRSAAAALIRTWAEHDKTNEVLNAILRRVPKEPAVFQAQALGNKRKSEPRTGSNAAQAVEHIPGRYGR